MTKAWEPKEQQLPSIARTIELISDELAELQEALNSPISFIDKISHRVASPYKTNQSIIRRDEEWMEFLQSHDYQWGLWTPIIGGILLYVGLNIRVTEVDPNE